MTRSPELRSGGATASGAPGARILVLPPEVASRIAAGEVIERPASVVKELLENSLDAGARRVEVLIEDGGRERIRVRDDGCGIAPEQLLDAFERHATSKLRAAEELFAVRTLGFRGEALGAIAAAGELDLTTRPAGHAAASVARFRGGRQAGVGAAAAAPGTAVEVRELFAALPARRRFLRDGRAETRAVAAVLADAALSRPEVAFRLEADGRTLLASEGTGSLRVAVAAVHGPELASALLALAYARQSEDGAAVEVSGAVAAPSLHRASRRALHLVVNGRAVTSRALLFAIEQAYAGLLPAGRHPAGVVRIDVPAEQVDVNVHPAKAEVRLRHERFVHGAVVLAVREALAGAPAPAWSSTAAPWPSLPPTPGAEARALIASARPALASIAVPAVAGGGLEAARGQPPLPGGERLPALRPLGQVDLAYLAAESPQGLVLVDQHAAHERVLYEQALEARAAGRVESQPLLAVVVAALSPSQAALAVQHDEALAALGWVLEATDGAALLVRAVPSALREQDPARALGEYLDRLEAEERLSAPDRAAAALACRGAVRAGDRLDVAQQRALLEALERSAQPQTCPHGRPTMLQLSREALDRSFGRPERGR